MTYEEAKQHLRRQYQWAPAIDREALEMVIAGPPVARREEVTTSPTDPRVEVATVQLRRVP